MLPSLGLLLFACGDTGELPRSIVPRRCSRFEGMGVLGASVRLVTGDVGGLIDFLPSAGGLVRDTSPVLSLVGLDRTSNSSRPVTITSGK